jgi:hypothetical protein
MIELSFTYPLSEHIQSAYELDKFLIEKGFYLNDEDDFADCATTYRWVQGASDDCMVVYCNKESLASYLKLLFYEKLIDEVHY